MKFRLLPMVAALLGFASSPAMARPRPEPFLTFGDVADAPLGFVEMAARGQGTCRIWGSEATKSVPDLCPRTRAEAAIHSLPVVGVAIGTSAIAAAPVHGSGDTTERTKAVSDGEQQDPAVLIQAINTRVNRLVRQRSDSMIFGVEEFWQAAGDGPDALGDCEDIALEKRAQLIAAGVDEKMLFLAIVYKRGVGLHTILVARTGTGDRVLDSLTSRIKPWFRAGYSWLRLQSPDDPMVWTRPAAAHT